MKGVVFNLLEEFIIANSDGDTYEEILDECTFVTDGPFVGPGTYPDEDLIMLVGKTVEKLGISAPAALRAFGKGLFPKLAATLPHDMTDYPHPKPFLMIVHQIIHMEVRKLYEDVAPPLFEFGDPAPDKLVIRHQSKRQMYDLMDGLIDGVADHFECPIEFTRQVQGDGSEAFFVYELTFDRAA
jgi:hypothetical protein